MAFGVVSVPPVRRALAGWPRGLAVVLWALAVLVVAMLVLVLSFDPVASPVGFGDTGCSAVVGRAVHVGLPGQ